MEKIFRTEFGQSVFTNKYAHEGAKTWNELSNTLVEDVCGKYLSKEEKEALKRLHSEMKFIAGGRYLYYAGRPNKFFNNCYLLKSEEDSREDWANLSWKAENCLMTGGGIGNDYSVYRAEGELIARTGGFASGPISKMQMINEIGKHVMQGASRRSALYGSLNWNHKDAGKFLTIKDWGEQLAPGTNLTYKQLKEKDFNASAPLDITNISLNYDNDFINQISTDNLETNFNKYLEKGTILNIKEQLPETFLQNVYFAMKNGEPGFSFNFFDKEKETLRNAPVSGSTRVLTDKGYKYVIDIVNKPVTLWTGDRWAYDVVFKLTKENSDLVLVRLSNGRSIICSPEHPFIVKEYIGKGQKKKVELKRIEASNLVMDQKIKSDLPNFESLEFNEKEYALGFVFGDGSISNKSGEITYFVPEKKESFDLTVNVLNAYTVSEDNRAYFKSDLDSKYELINKDLLSTSFIAGWFDADGNFSRDMLRLSSSNIEYLHKVQESLDFYGIKSVVRLDGNSSYKPESKSYTLMVYSSSLVKFKNLIPTKRVIVDISDDYKSYRESEIRVVSVEKLDYKENVYCCDVKVDEHSFMAEGVIISNCSEVCSEDDSDVCNLGSLNMANYETIEEWKEGVILATKFLLCGTLVAHLPYQKVYETREKNRRLGLGLMGVHEWLLKRGYRYEVVPELHEWLEVYQKYSTLAAFNLADKLSISRPVATRSIAPTGSIGILAGTTTGIEPLYAVAYKRRYLKEAHNWHYQYVIDGTAKILIEKYDLTPENIETAVDLSNDIERRIKFQADIQDYVDMCISSTLNVPSWGSKKNNEDTIHDVARSLAKYSHRLRGFTCYPDGSRGGQPLTTVSYQEALKNQGKEFAEEFHDVCTISGKGGTCGN